MYTVIRVLKYECENEDDMRRQMATSMPEGCHNKGHLTLTIGTYFSDLPPEPLLVAVDNEKLHSVLREATKDGQTNQ